MEELFQAPAAGWRGFIEAWAGFAEWRVLLRVCGSRATAIALAAALAFHPRTVRGPTVAEIEAPKTLILYAVIG
ncbi:MAG: hypothetical protein R3266_09785, partial [Gemmatimonadota bacterium]|nr:hypothetical protein [Gemmatimonadota bacterium]